MRRLFKSKRAISPVIATVLMILVTMVGMTLLFAFVTSYSDSYKAGIGSSVMESLTIEDIWLSPGQHSYDKTVDITIYNGGKIDSTITSAYANGLKLITQEGDMNLNTPIAVGQHVTLSLEWSSDWNSGQQYTFRISTSRGSNFETTCTAP